MSNGPQKPYVKPIPRTVTITIVDRPGLGPSLTTSIQPPLADGETDHGSSAIATACAMQDFLLKLQRRTTAQKNSPRKAVPHAN